MNTISNRIPSKYPALIVGIGMSDFVLICSVLLFVTNFFSLSSVTFDPGTNIRTTTSYFWISIAVLFVWIFSLYQTGSYSINNLGAGTREYALVLRATTFTFVIVAIFSYLLKAEIARSFLLFAFPVCFFLLLLNRWIWRKHLLRQRRQGRFTETAVILGSINSVSIIANRFMKNPEVGLRIVGIFLPPTEIDSNAPLEIKVSGSPFPVLGDANELISVVRAENIRNVIIGASGAPNSEDIRKLGWELLPGNERLFLATNVVDIAGPRLQLRPLAGMSIIEVLEPEFEGVNRIIKRSIDLVLGSFGLLLSIPIFFFAAIQIRLNDGGPIFYSQLRVGKAGKIFRIYKFRTMRIGSDQEEIHIENSQEENVGNEVLFKMKNDPRVTKPGRWLRRTSIDELPQLINVLGGSMSLVGPRPPLPSETESYESHVHTRFMVKPGITGLWQVSGRSDLSWEESVQADLSYVQNWSIISDFVILWRTVKVVISGRGAY